MCILYGCKQPFMLLLVEELFRDGARKLWCSLPAPPVYLRLYGKMKIEIDSERNEVLMTR